ncbi:MAG TPA: protein kinase, partial [Gemmatimonadaceae bacterium]|nr:protein kinase [Gemmatimonadaceae bacterium]
MTASELSGFRSELASRYTIEREIGRGGMATVYLAHDVRHSRRVALKVLDPELKVVLGKERFLTEIRVTANLHHPHLLPLYDSGEADGQLFYVMPFVDGESLRDRLNREKQLPVDDAIRIATAVGHAVDHAHRHGVIHRDLKPENILLHEGEPFVADFGIALALTRAGGTRITRTGFSLGTPQYTSPEQAAGDREVDGRTDVYALGAVLYEMLTGDPPHTGSTAQAIIAKVFTDEPRPVRLCRPSVPQHVEAAVERALAKVPGDRFATALDFVDALRTPSPAVVSPSKAGLERSKTVDAAPPRARGLRVHPWYAAASIAFLALAAVVALALRDRPAPRARVVRYELALSDSVRLRTADGVTIALSRDGSKLAYAGGPESGGQLFIRDLGTLVSIPIRGTERGRTPVFSPDGRSLLFTVDGKLKRVELDGGTPVTLSDSGSSASWGETGILAARGPSMYLIPAAGGPARRIAATDTARGVLGFSWPHPLPGGKAALVTIATSAGLRRTHIGVVRLSDGAVTDLGISGVSPRYLPTGHIIFAAREGTIYGMAFDVRRLRVSGPMVPLLEDVVVKNGNATEVAVSDEGTLVYRTGKFMRRVLLVDRRGVGTPLLAEPREYTFPMLSPDGTRLAVTIGSSTITSDTWVFDTRTGALTRLTRGGGERPEWTPDGRSIVTVSSDSS